MNILFDNGMPHALSQRLSGHEVSFARKVGWQELKNGDLIQKVENAGYNLLLTTDKDIRYQPNLQGRRIIIVALGSLRWPDVRLRIERIVLAVSAAPRRSFMEVEIPRRV